MNIFGKKQTFDDTLARATKFCARDAFSDFRVKAEAGAPAPFFDKNLIQNYVILRL